MTFKTFQEKENQTGHFRPIRFRAWDKKHNKMAQVYTLGLTGIEYTTICTDGELFSGCGKADIELMQFTGLLDSKGKEIYEGDILKERDFISEVIWDNEGAYFHLKRGDTYSGYTLKSEVERSEVVGNIYENPELLK